MHSEISNKIKQHFPDLNQPALVNEMEQRAIIKEVEAGTQIIQIGGWVKMMPLVTKGAIKVMKEDDEGSELFLYFLYPGQSCAVTAQCCLGNAKSQVNAFAEEDTEFIAIPIEFMNEWMKTIAVWRNFVLSIYHNRFNELLQPELCNRIYQKLKKAEL